MTIDQLIEMYWETHSIYPQQGKIRRCTECLNDVSLAYKNYWIQRELQNCITCQCEMLDKYVYLSDK